MLMMLARQPVEGQGLFNVLLDPAGQLRVLALPLDQPGGEIPPCLAEIASVVQPAQLLQAVIVDFARHIVERIPQEVHVGAVEKPG